MTWALKALMGVGIVASGATVAVVSSPSLRDSIISSSATRTIKELVGPSTQDAVGRENGRATGASPVTTASQDVEERRVTSSQNSGVSETVTSSSTNSTSRKLTEAEKSLVREKNPNLCKEIANRSYGDYLRICREDENSPNMEFEYFNSKHSSSVKIDNLKFAISDIVINLEVENSFGDKTVRMSLSQDMISGLGLFKTFAVHKDFAPNKCTLVDAQAENKDWKINC